MQTPPAAFTRLPRYRRRQQPHKNIFYWELEPVKKFLEAYALANGYNGFNELQRVNNWNLTTTAAAASLKSKDPVFCELARQALEAIEQATKNK